MKNSILSLMMILCLYTTLFGQQKNSTQITKRIETYLTELEKVGFSGSVLVEINGIKVISKGYGFSDRAKSIKNDPNTVLCIGSITKQFTATAILKLEMQGKLSTDDKIIKYFDNVPIDKSSITIHDLLRHQSGLQSNVGKDYDKISQAEFLDKVMNSKLLFEVGKEFSYSNIGYSLLGMIIEKTSGKTYETYLYENLWKPAQMEMTGYSRPMFDKSKIAIGYYKDDKIWGKPTDKEWDKTAPYWHLTANGGVLSTTEDMYKWHKALLGENILSKEAKNKLYHPKIRTEENYNAIYAYGWDVSQTDRKTNRVWHNGGNNIFYGDFIRYIDENITLIMLSNKSHQTNFDRLNFELSKMIFEKNYNPIIPIADNQANQKYSQNIIEIILNKGIEVGKESYKKRTANKNILEYILNAKGYDFLSQKNYEKAINLFIMNTFAFPKSANAFDSLGEAYMNKGDKILAIKHYEKSLELNPNNGNAKNMLLELRR
ncbi:serine hydrolase [Flavobacterium lacus]|uniref:CubicO group peptidase (Beta-lactamase class C family) n=1 Tax=Flavobacterium lacus TaxID=1353778 RepID=A0A328WVA1_9FLAO|nr:serine hydrolase [Flavobacterium lacus]RAR48407.1 CubicO group peptidase (beta-lactamase class C family) [Flavobacterium lacus]